ncbi:hypothetical protein LQW54_001661 [Pestalotiopsis sp. IQ-011]
MFSHRSSDESAGTADSKEDLLHKSHDADDEVQWDNIRRGLWPDRYRHEDYKGGQGMSLLSAKHLDHCVDQIRQVIMCASDVSTNWLCWDEEWQSNMPPGFTYHSCRNFDAVVDWAREHTVEPFGLKIRTPDPLQQE